MSPRERAVSILGHQEGCTLLEMDGPEGRYEVDPCRSYSDQLHVLIAAERGRLDVHRRAVRFDGYVWCPICCTHPDTRATPREHAEPLTPALAWELLVEIAPTTRQHRLRRAPAREVWTRLSLVFAGHHDKHAADLTPEFVARLYLALAEAGLLRRDDA